MSTQERILLWSANIWIFADGLFGPLFAVFAQEIGGDILEITWAWSAYLIMTGVASIIVGKISDSLIRKEVLVLIGYGLTPIFTFSYLLISSPYQLLFIQAGLGLALALSNAPWFALYSENAEKKKDGYVWGLADGLGKILAGVAIVAGGIIVSTFSFKALFITMGVLQIFAVIYQAQFFRYAKNKHRTA